MGPVSYALQRWMNTTLRPQMEQACIKRCSHLRGPARRCVDELLARNGTLFQRTATLQALQSMGSNVSVVDFFAMSDGKCDHTADGAHFREKGYALPQDVLVQVMHLLLAGLPSSRDGKLLVLPPPPVPMG